MSRKKFVGWFRRTGPMVCLALVAAAVIYAAPQASGYHVIKRMPVGGEGGWDYMTVDSDTHRLYIARGSHFMVVDDTTGKVIGDMPAGQRHWDAGRQAGWGALEQTSIHSYDCERSDELAQAPRQAPPGSTLSQLPAVWQGIQ